MDSHKYNQPLPSNPYNPLSWIDPGAIIGDNVWIGAFVYIGAHVEIGDNVSISNGVQIFDHDNSWHRVSEGVIEKSSGSVHIGSFTQIGANSVILAGSNNIRIGDHCIIGALSFVNKNIPNFTVASGSPARVVRYINDAVITEKRKKLCLGL